MGEILGVGGTHHPGFMYPDEHMADILRRMVNSDRVPPHLKDPKNWPAPMQQEYGADGGTAAAARHRERVIGGYRQLRAEVEAFRPDFILIWGDDQYENFKEDVVPSFCVYIMEEMEYAPFASGRSAAVQRNVWDEPMDKRFRVRGHTPGARHLTRRLLEEGFDLAYAYKYHHMDRLAHAFAQTMVYLDYDRKGWSIPVVPFHVNCYGSSLVRNRGGAPQDEGAAFDPPAPSPRRCFELGRATARILKDSPWRVVLMGSSSWSHAFLTSKNHYLYPDIESDHRRYEALKAGNYEALANLTLAELEEAGEHELLNWVCLAGAMHELGYGSHILAYEETYIFNSNKCVAVFKP